jgi:farnesyl-diphosphate farnesyltransferase
MAIATLADLYNNPKVFSGVVKIRKGQAAQLILDTKNTTGLHKWFNILSKSILSKVVSSDPNAAKTKAICKKIIELTDANAQRGLLGNYAQVKECLEALSLAGNISS